MCGEVHYGEVKELVFVERWSCSRGASCVVEYTMGRLRNWFCVEMALLVVASGASCVVMYVHFRKFDGLVTLRCGVCLCQVTHQYRVAVQTYVHCTQN